ncbi:MAG TPA: MBL fold metallo-hydrolase [bacterium]|nr:MBL fold metallo-hydrolase [bacterium]
MRQYLLLPTLLWAITATALLGTSLAWPDALRSAATAVADYGRPRAAEAQPAVAPARLEWLGWQFFRVTTPRGKVILFNPALNDPRAIFRNQESPLSLEDIDKADLILVADGHADDQGMAVEIARKTGASVVTTFELAQWMVGRGVDTTKILRSEPGSRWDIDGIKIQVVNSVHGSGAPALPNVPAAVYGGPALGFIVTLENGVRIYHAGSTALTMDLQLYGRLYRPQIALLPIASGMLPDEAAIAAELLRADNPDLVAVFPQHHASFMSADRRGRAFVDAVNARSALRGRVRAYDPRPGDVYFVTPRGVRIR